MQKLTIAIQKSGRLSEGSLKLLKDCGIAISNGNNNLKATAEGFPLELIFLRDDDIPRYVADSVAQAGIIGLNEVLEQKIDVNILHYLGFSRCRLSIALPREMPYQGLSSLSGKRIATSYPSILADFLDKQGILADIHPISGSVEVTPSLGLADAIFEIVSSGGTLLSNGLKEVDTILKSEAVLIANKDLLPWQNEIINKILFRIQAVQKARKNKYILLNAPEANLPEIIRLIPGMKSPTILPLAEKGWCSLHSVVPEDDFWEIIQQLKDAGAQGILVVPIEKMIV